MYKVSHCAVACVYACPITISFALCPHASFLKRCFLSLLCYPASYMSYVWGGGAPFPSEHGAALLCEGFGSMDPTKAPLGQIYIYTPMAVGTYRPLRRSTMPVWTAWAAIRNAMAHDGPEGGRVVVKVPPPCPPFITS